LQPSRPPMRLQRCADKSFARPNGPGQYRLMLQPKIVITGTGRAGTTFLVRLFTELGLDTGYTPATWQRDYFAHCSAGLEQDPSAPDAPRIVKSPELCDTLAELLASRKLAVEHAIIPIRSLEDAARSRVRVGGDGQTPGGLTGTGDPGRQPAVLAERFHRLVHTLVAHEIPHTFIEFPWFARDAGYAWRKLSPIFPEITRVQFSAAFARSVQPELIHDFRAAPADTVAADLPARLHAQTSFQRRLRRRLARTALLVSVAAAGWWLAIWWHGHG